MMNKVRQKAMIHQCESRLLIRTQSQTRQVATSGGWCLHASQPNSGEHVCDKPLALAIGSLLKGQRVAGFGDGPGMYKSVYDAQMLMTSYDAYDGSPYIENITQNAVKFMDLTLPQYGLPLYDWVVCLEVAEHVPRVFQAVLVDNIARHARVGVVLSWAVPGQYGLGHVNNRSPLEVEAIMLEAGFVEDTQNSSALRAAATVSWLKRNVGVFRRLPHVIPDPLEA